MLLLRDNGPSTSHSVDTRPEVLLGLEAPRPRVARVALIQFVVAIVLAFASVASAQSRWEQLQPSPRRNAATAYDTARARLVMFGGVDANGTAGDTWEWDGAAWALIPTVTAPPPRSGHAMAYNAARHRTVLFGGLAADNTTLGDTWEWDGASWVQGPTAGPSMRMGHAMAYDAAHGTTVLFGGAMVGGETWIYDGAWTSRAAAGPATRSGHAMASAPSGHVLLFGGGPLNGPYLGDTWDWNGTTWTRVAQGGPAPAARMGLAMAYDSARSRVVLFGGYDGVTPLRFGDTWEWNGTAWTLITTAGPQPRLNHTMAYDAARGNTVVFGGSFESSGCPSTDETWRWDGAVWTRGVPAAPGPREFHAMDHDSARHRTVLFGGYSRGYPYYDLSADTWEWDGGAWSVRANTGPSARAYHAMAFDSRRGRSVLFGGQDPTGYLGDTWEWDGTTWVTLGSDGPGIRVNHAMAYDSVRGVVVLFGGQNNTGAFADTWTWDGALWSPVPVSGPVARHSHLMAFDSLRGVTVLYGGSAGSNETWEWDGTTWYRPATSGPPGANINSASMAFDAVRGRTVLFVNADTWEWDGTTWVQQSSSGPSGRQGSAAVFDAAAATVVLFGGVAGACGPTADLWGWRVPVPPSITRQPADLAVSTGQTAVFAVQATGQGPLTYQWRRDGVNISGDSRFTGASTPTLTISSAILTDAGAYTVFVGNPSGSVLSRPAALHVGTGNSCPADMNGDGVLNVQDFLRFLQAYAAGCP